MNELMEMLNVIDSETSIFVGAAVMALWARWSENMDLRNPDIEFPD